MTSKFRGYDIDDASGEEVLVVRTGTLPLDHYDSRMRCREDYMEQKQRVLELLTADGGECKLSKMVPAIRHRPDMDPAVQYPAGTGKFQLTLMIPQRWLVRAFIPPGQVLSQRSVIGATVP
jgi:hypothetical protein